MKFCQAPNCSMPVFGKGYCKAHQYLREDFDRRSITQKAMDKNKLKKDFGKLKNLPENKEAVDNQQSKSALLKLADNLFSKFIKNRDADKDGVIICPGCNVPYNINDEINFDEVKNRGEKIVQCLHFIERDVYAVRFDEDNAAAGCMYCNLDMFLNKKGKAWSSYRAFLVKKIGPTAVEEMELLHRNIGKLDIEQLKNIIEHYS